MYIKTDNNILRFKKNNTIDYSNLFIPKNMFVCRDNIVKIDNNYYYIKNKRMINCIFKDYNSIINEIIGSYFCKILELDSLDYDIGICRNNVYSISKYFYNNNYTYDYINKYFKISSNLIYSYGSINVFLSELLDQVEDKELLSNILKLICIDLRMGQVDRHEHNIIMKNNNNNGKIELAPILDFSNSYFKSSFEFTNSLYVSPLLVISKNSTPIYNLCDKYPEFINYIEKLCIYNIDDILNQIENDKDIIFNSREIKYYKDKDKENVKMLKFALR